ncbi:hypothetical protein C1645_834725 [Glomus cerebriforme]|uniref:Uncharacterized protein n=1 Tax=Glomus cerebriforme TaxID=658196 RepID=A0A397SFV1_9GLOM|nr:hypothetical protein C1645_834725 [Glomus cerebriforme]
MKNWKSNNTQIMVTISAFEMGINSNNVLVIIHIKAPINISKYIVLPYFYLSNYSNLYICLAANFIQEAGCAERDGNTAMHIIFFSKKDMESITANEQNLTNKLE